MNTHQEGTYPTAEGFDPRPAQWAKVEKPAEQRDTAQLGWGAFDESGKLRAILESESEAYFYVKNRGHMFNGSHRKVTVKNNWETLAHAERLAEALQDTLRQLLWTNPPYSTETLAAMNDAKAALKDWRNQ